MKNYYISAYFSFCIIKYLFKILFWNRITIRIINSNENEEKEDISNMNSEKDSNTSGKENKKDIIKELNLSSDE